MSRQPVTYSAAFALGDKVTLCGDSFFVATVAEVSFSPDKVMYRLVWRNGRVFEEGLYTEGAIRLLENMTDGN